MSPTPPPSSAPRPVRKRRRWLRRIGIGLVSLIVLAVVCVQIVLWTSIPKGIVVGQIERQLGLRLSVDSLTTGWLGHTQLNNVSISLPLADKAFLTVPVMKVKNTSLFGLLVGQSVEVQAIELDGPHLVVFQDSDGRWNVQEVIELLGRAGGKKTGQDSAQTSNPVLPDVHLTGGVVSVVDNQKRTVEISPLSVEGYPDTGVSWKYDVQIPSRVAITGRLVPGGNWGHEVAIKLDGLDAWAKPWMADFPKVSVDVSWRGGLSPTGIGGRLQMRKISVGLKTGMAEISGGLAAEVNDGAVSVRPDNLLVATGQQALPNVAFSTGLLEYNPNSHLVSVKDLIIKALGGPARLSGQYNLDSKAGKIDLGWERLALPGKMTHSGSFAVEVRHPYPNQVVLGGHLNSTGETPTGPWLATADFNANGESWQNIDWTIHTGQFQWNRQVEGINLDGLALVGAVRGQTLTVQSISMPKADQLAGRATYNFTGNQAWTLYVEGQHWPFHPIAGTELAFEVKARGDIESIVAAAQQIAPSSQPAPATQLVAGQPTAPASQAALATAAVAGARGGPASQPESARQIGADANSIVAGRTAETQPALASQPASLVPSSTPPTVLAGPLRSTEIIYLDDFKLKSPDGQFSANGTYTVGSPKPLAIDVTVTNAPPTQAPIAIASTPEAKVINGTVDGHASLVGTLNPLQLKVSGHFNGREIDVRGHHFGEIDLLLSDESHVDGNGAFIYTKSLNFLGGQWGIDGDYMYDKGGLDVNVKVADVSLKNVATLVGQEGISGMVNGQLALFVPGLNPSLTNLQIPKFNMTFSQVAAFGVGVEQIAATVSLHDGVLEAAPIRLKQGKGTGDVRVKVDVNNPRRIELGAKFDNWPVDAAGSPVHLDAGALLPAVVITLPDPMALDPDARKLRITARQIDVHGSPLLNGELLGEMEAHAGLDGREIDVRAVHLKLLGGRMDGQAHGDFDHPFRTTAEFTWQDLDLEKLALIFPALKDLKGQATGGIRLAPTTVPRPREPLAVVIKTIVAKGSWRTVPIKDMKMAAYVGPNEEAPDSGWRIVLDDSPSHPNFIHVDDGSVELWGRFGFHGRASSAQAAINFSNLDLNKFVRAAEPTGTPMPGRLSGNVLILRAPPVPKDAPPLALNQMFPNPPPVLVQPLAPPNPNDAPIKGLIKPIYADGEIQISNANLGNFGPFAFLYNAANLFQNDKKLEGSGNVQFHLEDGNLSIQRLRYFNRGTEIRAVAIVKEIWNVPYSPLQGSGYVTARPLREVRLPILNDFDTILTAVQSSLKLTGTRVSGTLDKYHMSPPLGLADMTDEMRRFFVADVKSQGGGTD